MTDKKVAVFMTAELKGKLEVMAKADGRNLARYIEAVLKRHVESRERAA